MNTITRIQYEKVQAGDIQPGDRVARARTHPFKTVAQVIHGDTAVRLVYDVSPEKRAESIERAGYRRGSYIGPSDRPRKTATWWRELSTEVPA